MEQLTEFQLFIKSNKLKQKQVADYLETSPQYINQVAKGLCDLSDEKYERLVQSDWDVSMLNIPPYIKVPATVSVFSPTDEERKEIGEGVDIKAYPAEVVEEIREEIKAEIEEAESVLFVSSKVANDATINVRKYIEKRGDEMERIKPSDLVAEADIAERIRKGSMMPTFMPGDIVFVRFLDDKKIISDGHTYYFDLKDRPTIIRKVKFDGEKLRLIAENPTFGDIITSFADIENVADIVGMFRSSFSNQYAEIEAVRRKKDEQIDNLLLQNGGLIEQNGEALKIIRDLMKK
jgi:transcriptional regulator with XRE-family HTH domain